MSHNFTQLFYHIIYGTKNRAPFISQSLDDELGRYTGGMLNNLGCELLAFGAFDDHVHLVISMPPHISLSEVVGKVKANSSRWLRAPERIGHVFGWQQGFTAFTVSQARLNKAKNYVNSQREHHTKQSFDDELAEFMKAFG